MTTERIDHVSEANRILDNLNPPDRFVFEQTKLAFAQVHATLALVEQQRTANLIALFMLDKNDAWDFAEAGVVYAQVLVEIKEGLGLLS